MILPHDELQWRTAQNRLDWFVLVAITLAVAMVLLVREGHVQAAWRWLGCGGC